MTKPQNNPPIRSAPAWDLIGFDGSEGLVRVKGGRSLYESVDYSDDTPGDQVRLSRIGSRREHGEWYLHQFTRYVDPDTILEVVSG